MTKQKEQTLEEKVKNEVIDYINLIAKITPLFISKNQENEFIQQIISLVREDERERIYEEIEKIEKIHLFSKYKWESDNVFEMLEDIHKLFRRRY